MFETKPAIKARRNSKKTFNADVSNNTICATVRNWSKEDIGVTVHQARSDRPRSANTE